MTEAQALREDNFMKPIRGFDNELAFCKTALLQHIKNIYKDFEEDKPSKRRVRTNMVTPDKGLPNFRSYMDVREFLLTTNTNKKGQALTFNIDGKEIKISTFGKPYFSTKDGSPDLTFDECGLFYKTLFNYKFMLEESLAGNNPMTHNNTKEMR